MNYKVIAAFTVCTAADVAVSRKVNKSFDEKKKQESLPKFIIAETPVFQIYQQGDKLFYQEMSDYEKTDAKPVPVEETTRLPISEAAYNGEDTAGLTYGIDYNISAVIMDEAMDKIGYWKWK